LGFGFFGIGTGFFGSGFVGIGVTFTLPLAPFFMSYISMIPFISDLVSETWPSHISCGQLKQQEPLGLSHL
jgi:hypothetical protein